jgi:WD40 repeat protein
VVFSPDSKHLASVGLSVSADARDLWVSADARNLPIIRGELKVWDAMTGREVFSLQPNNTHPQNVLSVSFSPNGNLLAIGAEQSLMVIDLATGQETLNLINLNEPFSQVKVAYSPDGRHIASTSWDQKLRVWDTDSGQEFLVLDGHLKENFALAYSPDGRYIASAGEERTVKVWDSATGKLVHDLAGHTDVVSSVAFSSDGKRITSGSGDMTVKVWDVSSGKEIHTLRGHRGPVSSVAFSADGQLRARSTLKSPSYYCRGTMT